MEAKNKTSIIVACIGAAATVTAAFVGNGIGEKAGKETATQEIAQTMEVNINNEGYSGQIEEISERYLLVKEELIDAENSITSLEKERDELLAEIERLEKSSSSEAESDSAIESTIKKQDGEQENLLKVCPPYDGNNYFTEEFTMSGDTFKDGFYMRASSSYVLINLKGEFSQLSFDFGHVDGGNKSDCKLNIMLDDEELDTIEGLYDELYENHTIDVTGVQKLQIELGEGEYYDYYGFTNLMLVR